MDSLGNSCHHGCNISAPGTEFLADCITLFGWSEDAANEILHDWPADQRVPSDSMDCFLHSDKVLTCDLLNRVVKHAFNKMPYEFKDLVERQRRKRNKVLAQMGFVEEFRDHLLGSDHEAYRKDWGLQALLIESFKHSHRQLLADLKVDEILDSIPDKELAACDLVADEKCIICHDNRKPGDIVAALPCGHWADRECLEGWWQNSMTCPKCRTTFGS